VHSSARRPPRWTSTSECPTTSAGASPPKRRMIDADADGVFAVVASAGTAGAGTVD
jgi:hypothetical protein